MKYAINSKIIIIIDLLSQKKTKISKYELASQFIIKAVNIIILIQEIFRHTILNDKN